MAMSPSKHATGTITRKKAEAASDFMKRLANPSRLMIACALVRGERSVGELESALGLKQPALSQQLAELRDAGIVESRREVKQVFYRLSDPRAVALIAALHRIFCGEELDFSSVMAAPTAIAARSPRLAAPTPIPVRRRSSEAASFARVMPPDTAASEAG
jgi:DNA-binding transcriptional ArsR family regulator